MSSALKKSCVDKILFWGYTELKKKEEILMNPRMAEMKVVR